MNHETLDHGIRRSLGETDSSRLRSAGEATVTIDHADIVKMRGAADANTVVIHEVMGHLEANFAGFTKGMTKEEREALAEEITNAELNKIPAATRPSRLPKDGSHSMIGHGDPGHARKTLIDGVDVSDPFSGK